MESEVQEHQHLLDKPATNTAKVTRTDEERHDTKTGTAENRASGPGVMVEKALASARGPGIPPSHRRILSAEYVGRGKQRKAVAVLEMFDGLRGVVEVEPITVGGFPSWCHSWRELEGGPIVWDGAQWRRSLRVTGPYECMRCLSGTDNDDDLCDECRNEASPPLGSEPKEALA